MKTCFLLCGTLLLMILPLWGNMAFDAQVPLYDFANPELAIQSTICPNGNYAVLYLMSKMGLRSTYLQVFNPQNQALWDEPVCVYGKYLNSIKLVANQDNSISICSLKRNENYDLSYEIDTYDPQGNPVAELSGKTVYQRYGLSGGNICFLSDSEGGLHFSIQDGNYNYRYQYIDSAGNLSYPESGLNLGNGEGNYGLSMITTSDNGAVITYPNRNDSNNAVILLSKIDANHQLAWQSEYQSSEPDCYHLLTLDGPDNSFYTIASYQTNRIEANRIDYLGNTMWQEAWTPQSSPNRIFDSAVVTSLGNLVVHSWYRQSYDVPYSYYYDVVESSGITLISSETDHSANLLVADHYGGWYALDIGYNYTNTSNLVQHYDSTFVPESVPLDFAPDVYLPHYTAFISPDGENLQILYDWTHENQAEICTQLVDNQLNLAFPPSGFCLVSGESEVAFNVMAVTLANGSLFSMWGQGSSSYDAPHKIMYNIVTPRGQTVFANAQCFMENAQNILRFWLFPVSDGNVLICWTLASEDNYTTYAQLLIPGTGVLWGHEGRLLFSGAGEPQISYSNGSLYLARRVASEIRIHRFVEGLPVWDSNGVLAAVPNPDYLGNTLSWYQISGNRLFWSQQDNTVYPEMSFMNAFTEDGTLLFPTEGLPLATLSEDYLGISIAKIFPQETDLIVMLKYHYRVWEFDQGPNSTPSWHYYWTPGFSIVQPDGSIIQQAIFSSYDYEDIMCMMDGAYYCTSAGNAPIIKKYDLSGNCLWSVQYAIYSGIRSLLPLPDGSIMIISRLYDLYYQHKVYYALLSADGNIEYPPDALFAEGNCQAAYTSDFGAYLLMVQYPNEEISHGAGVQYFELSTWDNDDPHLSPQLLAVSQNHPNPFREQTALNLKMPDEAQLKLRVYNIRGQCVRTIYDQALGKGDHLLTWDGKDKAGQSCASGVYIFRAETPFGSKTVKALKLK
nr:hypothetical protein [Candidatus Cloacimonadota bacterium]